MSRGQRRDHDVIVGADDKVGIICIECNEVLEQVYHRQTGRYYWRHHRRWHRKP